MNIIGFDFGTTNSTISCYNPETKELDCFQPSVVCCILTQYKDYQNIDDIE